MDLLLRRIGFAVGEQNVSAAPAELGEYAPAGAPLPGELVVWPAAGNEVAQLVGIVREHGGALFAVRQGTRLPPDARRPRVLCDLRRMASILHLDETSLTVHAQAGIALRALEASLARRGLTLGYFPIAALAYPLGALLARRHPELAAAHAGPLLRACVALSAALANGQLAHTRVAPRHAAGPDLMHLLLGCEGQLGIITAAVLRVTRIPEERRFAAFRFPAVAAALAGAAAAFRRGVRLAAVRIYDAADARRCFGPDAGAGPAPAAAPAGALLVCCAASTAELCAAEVRVVTESCEAHGGVDAGSAPAEHWWRRRTLTPEEPARTTVAPDALVASVQGGLCPPPLDGHSPSSLPLTARSPREPALERAKSLVHPASANPLVFHAPVQALLPLYDTIAEAVRSAHARCAISIARLHLGGGCLLVTLETDARARDRLSARLRALAAPHVVRDALAHPALLRGLKGRLDPDFVLNPGRLPPEAVP